jgi:hypothetical protein
MSPSLLKDLLFAARMARAAYGYTMAAGHLASVTNAIKLIATLPVFDPISGEAGGNLSLLFISNYLKV